MRDHIVLNPPQDRNNIYAISVAIVLISERYHLSQENHYVLMRCRTEDGGTINHG
jgi:hypothetical protein